MLSLALLACGCRSVPVSATRLASVAAVPPVEDPRFAEFLAQHFGTPSRLGNQVVELPNGDRFVPAMIDAIRNARRSVILETYILWSDDVGRPILAALAERARAGVRVHLLADWFGSRYLHRSDVRALRAAGVNVHLYHRQAWLNPGRLHHRDHRKILVVDSRVAFTGGAGLGKVWQGNGDGRERWRDSFFRVEGPVVADLERLCAGQWQAATGTSLDLSTAAAPPAPAGEMIAQALPDRGRDGQTPLLDLFLLAIGRAQKSVRIGTAYFVPEPALVDALVDARRRGVRVEILMPGRYLDSWIVRPATRARLGALFEAGVRLYGFEPAMYHAKVLIVDDAWVSVGSCNLDNRSLRINDEANLNVHSPAFAANQIAQFELDCSRSRRLSYDAWRRRSCLHRLVEWLVCPIVPLI